MENCSGLLVFCPPSEADGDVWEIVDSGMWLELSLISLVGIGREGTSAYTGFSISSIASADAASPESASGAKFSGVSSGGAKIEGNCERRCDEEQLSLREPSLTASSLAREGPPVKTGRGDKWLISLLLEVIRLITCVQVSKCLTYANSLTMEEYSLNL